MPFFGTFGSNSSRAFRGFKKWQNGLYAFENVTFNVGDGIARTGPSLSGARAAMTGTPPPSSWNNNTSYFNTSSGIQLWTVPATGAYRIEAYGAQGGGGINSALRGGYGAVLKAEFNLTGGEVIKILCGQQGTRVAGGNPVGSGGGGGTFVVLNNNSILVIAGGGAGGCGSVVGLGGVITQDPGLASGTSGTNGASYGGKSNTGGNYAGGGGGWQGNGGNSGGAITGGLSFLSGGAGGAGYDTGRHNDQGGFGGGGGACHASGGGGGYTGGGGGTGYDISGAGGGSINNGANQNNVADSNTGSGKVVITRLS